MLNQMKTFGAGFALATIFGAIALLLTVQKVNDNWKLRIAAAPSKSDTVWIRVPVILAESHGEKKGTPDTVFLPARTDTSDVFGEGLKVFMSDMVLRDSLNSQIDTLERFLYYTAMPFKNTFDDSLYTLYVEAYPVDKVLKYDIKFKPILSRVPVVDSMKIVVEPDAWYIKPLYFIGGAAIMYLAEKSLQR